MSVLTLIYSALSGDSFLNNETGGDIFPVISPPEAKRPYIVYTRTGAALFNTKEKPTSAEQVGLQVDVYADTVEKVEELGARVDKVLEGLEDSSTEVSITGTARSNTADEFREGQETPHVLKEFELFIVNKP